MAENKYGLIVVGGGITGLSTALAWTKEMQNGAGRVLLLEKNKVLGGCVSTFARRGYRFDTTQLIPESSDLFAYFGLDLRLVKFEGYYSRIFLLPDVGKKAVEIRIPAGVDAFGKMLEARYPIDQKAIHRFIRVSKKMYAELKYLKVRPTLFQLAGILARCPTIVKYSRSTFREFLRSFGFKNKELTEIFDVFCAFSGMSAERCAALLTISAMQASLAGSYRPEKGFISLPYAFKKKIVENGGEVRTGSPVKRITIENGKATGVELESGEKIRSGYVVTTIDSKVALHRLVGQETVRALDKKYARKWDRLKMSVSAATISLGLDENIDLQKCGLNCGYNVLTTGRGTFESLFKAHDAGRTGYSKTNFHCAVICPSLVTGGKPVVVIRVVPVPMGNWKKLRETDPPEYQRKKEELAGFFIDAVDKHMIPGLKKHIVFKDVATPATFERYLGSPTGSNYGMAPYVDNFGRTRLSMRTPVKNLYQPKFSHGIWPSMQAGLQVIDMISGGKIMKGASRYARPAG